MTLWAAEWRSKNRMDGERRHLLARWPPTREAGCQWPVATFATRKECRAWIKKHHGYIAKRPDLQAEPHGWQVPQPVQIEIATTKVERKRNEQAQKP